MEARNHDGPVLFAYDGSDHAKAAIRQAGRQLRSGRRAIVLTVWVPAAAQSFAPAPVVTPAGPDQASEQDASRLADEGAELARAGGFDAEPSAERGESVWRRIVDSAKEHDAGILVLGTHGRTGLSLLIMGSVATAATRHTERTVMIVHNAASSLDGELR